MNPLKRVALAIQANVLGDSRAKEFKRWFDDKGDETLRLHYPLSQASIVYDLGGFKGDFAADVHKQYQSTIHLFEPVPDFHAHCIERFKGIPNIHSHCFGLSSQAGSFELSMAQDGSTISAAKASSKNIKVAVQSVTEFIRQARHERIALMKINIEGGEYDLLQAIIDSGMIDRIENIQVQFHDFIEGAHAKRDRLREQLRSTHDETWCYTFVWENWRKKASSRNEAQQLQPST
jgi:FkbM family methyltransferase